MYCNFLHHAVVTCFSFNFLYLRGVLTNIMKISSKFRCGADQLNRTWNGLRTNDGNKNRNIHKLIALFWYSNSMVAGGVACIQPSPPTLKVRYLENGLGTNNGTKSTNEIINDWHRFGLKIRNRRCQRHATPQFWLYLAEIGFEYKWWNKKHKQITSVWTQNLTSPCQRHGPRDHFSF